MTEDENARITAVEESLKTLNESDLALHFGGVWNTAAKIIVPVETTIKESTNSFYERSQVLKALEDFLTTIKPYFKETQE
ncbi:MAG TPA: hypothetical protein VMD05_07980 [Candidatus Nanoarchaeia archaeon]|nr:hypothetical protein [Candidatus Nanoarchaeia archaeon]